MSKKTLIIVAMPIVLILGIVLFFSLSYTFERQAQLKEIDQELSDILPGNMLQTNRSCTKGDPIDTHAYCKNSYSTLNGMQDVQAVLDTLKGRGNEITDSYDGSWTTTDKTTGVYLNIKYSKPDKVTTIYAEGGFNE